MKKIKYVWKQKLKKNREFQNELLANVSHDLRTPLTSIYGNASNLLCYDKDLLPEEKKKIYSDILEDSGWLNSQFENILSMTRLESSSDLQRTVENMEDVIEESLRHISPHPDHTICFDSTDQDLFVIMDPRLIMQVMVNLLNNAIKYTPAGSSIHVRMNQDGDMVCVEVADNGPGIPDEDKPHVFELFYTGKHILEDSYRSMGIGLNLCAMIIHAHGGEIEVSDNNHPTGDGSGDGSADTPHGAVFRFTLPAAKIPLPE